MLTNLPLLKRARLSLRRRRTLKRLLSRSKLLAPSLMRSLTWNKSLKLSLPYRNTLRPRNSRLTNFSLRKMTASLSTSLFNKFLRRLAPSLTWLTYLLLITLPNKTLESVFSQRTLSDLWKTNSQVWMSLVLLKWSDMTNSREILSNSRTNALFWKSTTPSLPISEFTKCCLTYSEESSTEARNSLAPSNYMDLRTTKSYKPNLTLLLRPLTSLWAMVLTILSELEALTKLLRMLLQTPKLL